MITRARRKTAPAHGFLIRKRSYSDTSLILTWLTRERGFVKTLARGAQRPKNAFHGQADLFYEVSLLYRPAPRSDLHTLQEIHLMDAHLPLRRSYEVLRAATACADFLHGISEMDTPIPEHYALYAQAIAWLETHEPVPALTTRFEKKALQLAGLG